MSCHEPSATTKRAQHPPRMRTVTARDHMRHRDPLASLWTRAASPQESEEGNVFDKSHRGKLEQHGGVPSLLMSHGGEEVCWLHQHCIPPALSTRLHHRYITGHWTWGGWNKLKRKRNHSCRLLACLFLQLLSSTYVFCAVLTGNFILESSGRDGANIS